MNKTYIVPVPSANQELVRELSRLSGRIYSKTISTIRKIKLKKDLWLSEGDMKKLIRLYAADFGLHAQSKQGTVEQYFDALKSYFNGMENADNPRPPYRTKKYNKIIYKKSAITAKANGYYRFSNGRKGKALMIRIPKLTRTPKYAELIYNYNESRYQIHIVVEVENKSIKYENDKTLAIDLGVIHPMVTYDEQNTVIYNGGKVNSILRFRNKELGKLQNKISLCKKYSKRWKRLNRAKRRLLAKSKNKVNDLLQKYTSHLVSYCIDNQISTVVVGDIKGIRKGAKFSAKSSQKIHQWLYNRIYEMIKYKARSVGIQVDLQEESYTSQNCPSCNTRNKTDNRNYICQECGLTYHRDGVGAFNIYKKYLGYDHVEGGLTPPVGIRYRPDLRCHSEWNTSPFKKAG